MHLEKVKRLLTMYEQGLIPALEKHEVNPGLPPGSRENYLYFTLPVCINFQRNSPAMWTAALATWEDEATRYVFSPEKLAKTPLEQIRVDLVKHKLALQPNKHVLIWTTIAKTLHDYYQDDPREIIKEAGNDAGKLIELLQKTHRSAFHISADRSFQTIGLSFYRSIQTSSSKMHRPFPSSRILMYCKAVPSSE